MAVFGIDPENAFSLQTWSQCKHSSAVGEEDSILSRKRWSCKKEHMKDLGFLGKKLLQSVLSNIFRGGFEEFILEKPTHVCMYLEASFLVQAFL
jgi:hypothetical protein